METTYKDQSDSGNRIVYVRKVAVAGLPDVLRDQIGDDAIMVYSVHGENGEPLALVANREMAFALAREHHFAPMSVH